MKLSDFPRFVGTCPEPGIYESVPATDYFQWPAVSASLLKIAAASTMAHARHWLNSTESQGTDAMRFGQAYHAFVLEPERFDDRYYVIDKIRRAGKEWDAAQAAAGDREILWTEEHRDLSDMLLALRQQTRTRKLIRVPGAFECCVVWDDEATGLRCKARIDKLLPEPHNIALDLKSAASADPLEFAKAAANLRYDLQAAFYTDGIKAATGRDVSFIFIAQEKEPPYLSSLIDASDERCDPSAVACGREKYRSAMTRLLTALQTENWPGYGDEPYPLQLPAWAIPESMRVGV